MKKIFLGPVLFLLVISSSHAQQATQEELDQLVQAIGLYEQLEEQKLTLKKQAASSARKYASTIAESFPKMPMQMQQEMEKELVEYLAGMDKLFDTEHSINLYTNLLGPKLSSNQVREVTAFYESELGKAFTRVNTEISGPWMKAFLEDFNIRLMAHMKQFAEKLNAISQRYKQRHNQSLNSTPQSGAN